MNHWQFWALLAALFAALTALLSKAGLRDVEPDVALAIRTAVSLVIVVAVFVPGGGWRALGALSLRTWMMLGLAGAATCASWMCYFRALAIGSASRVAAVDKLSVVIIAVAASVVLGERLPLLGWLGVLLAVVGVMLISWTR